MSNIMACLGNYAENPYCFRKYSVRVWSVEELCYFFITNPFLLDGEVLGKELVDWLDRECGLKELAGELHKLISKEGGAKPFVETVLSYVNYCSAEEQGQIGEILEHNVGLSDYVRKKNKGDYFAEKRKYATALQMYDEVLEELPPSEEEIRGKIYHNKGVVYTRLFEFKRGAECFEQAYDLSGMMESLIQMLCARRQYLSDKEYVAWMADHPEYYESSMKVEQLFKDAKERFEATEESRMLFAMKIYREEGNSAQYYQDMGKQLSRLKMEYVDCMTE